MNETTLRLPGIKSLLIFVLGMALGGGATFGYARHEAMQFAQAQQTLAATQKVIDQQSQELRQKALLIGLQTESVVDAQEAALQSDAKVAHYKQELARWRLATAAPTPEMLKTEIEHLEMLLK